MPPPRLSSWSRPRSSSSSSSSSPPLLLSPHLRTIALFCLLKAFAVCLVGLAYGSIAVHRLDHSSPSSSSSFNNNNFPPAARSSSSSGISGGSSVSGTTGREVVGVRQRRRGSGSGSRRPSVGYVVSITGCGNDERSKKRGYGTREASALIMQGAAVLRHSVHLAHHHHSHHHHHRNNNSTTSSSSSSESKYDYEMIAIVHPAAIDCPLEPLSKLGYTVLVRNTPFETENIRNGYFKSVVDGASCCGSKEYLKLYAYTLTMHDVAVVLDLDSVILKPLDGLFDALLLPPSSSSSSAVAAGAGAGAGAGAARPGVPVHRGGDTGGDDNATTATTTTSGVVEAFFTRDYNMIDEGNEMYAGVQGGFLMVRPSERAFREYIEIVLEGNYVEGRGWGGRYGWAFGGAQIQGICAYYYMMIHPDGRGIELDRCKVNAMVDGPRFETSGRCRDGREDCDDCRDTPLDAILSAHFTLCGKPWECRSHWDAKSEGLCSKLHSEWFRIRRSFEASRTDVSDGDGRRQLPDLGGSGGAYRPETYFGYCTGPGSGGYLPIKV